ncbi:MAG: hypothetical protein AB7N70_02955 [Dehalococcoidia bacterium]
MKHRTPWLLGAALAVALVGAACGDNDTDNTAGNATPASSVPAAAVSTMTPVAPAAPTSNTKAAELRTVLNGLLSEHVALASSATAGALGGRQAQFDGAAAALDDNSVDLSKAIGSVYGAQAEQAFLPLWRKHIGFFVDYTQGVAAKDQAKQQKAVADLTQYAQDFGAFLAAANPNLPKETIAGLVTDHVLTLKAVVDAQASGDQARQYAAIREAYGHMHMIADPLAGAIVTQFPDTFPGDAGSKASTLRSQLNTIEREHVYLAARATGAALGGREAEFKAAADALDANSVDLSKMIGAAYGTDAERAFLPSWRKHIGFIVDYTEGLAAKDQAKQQKAVADLTSYSQDFGAFLNSANGLPKDAVAALVMDHILTLKTVIDAQAAGDQAKVYDSLRSAMGHMQMVADPLAEATVQKFPDKFTG